MKTFDVIALGELNVDLILNRIAGFPEVGKEIFARDMICTLGSSTAIFAANVSALGARTAFAGMIGRDAFGELVRGSLEARGVDTRYVIEAADRATGVTVVMSYGEDRANVTYPGAMEALRFADLDPEIFLSARHIHLSSLFTQWDPAEEWRIDCREVLPLIDVFMPNEAELTALAHAASLDEAIGSVRPWLRRAMIVKRGSRGSVLVTAGGECREVGALLNREAVDTIGAGDSFNAGFIRCFVRGGSLGECQDAGNLTGAISTTAAGGTGAFADREAVVRTARERFGKQLNLD